MLGEIIAFEVKYHLRQPLFHIAAAVFFVLAMLLVSTPAAEVFSQTPGPVYRNAPTAVMLNLTVFSLLGLLIVTAFVASSVLRDFELGTARGKRDRSLVPGAGRRSPVLTRRSPQVLFNVEMPTRARPGSTAPSGVSGCHGALHFTLAGADQWNDASSST